MNRTIAVAALAGVIAAGITAAETQVRITGSTALHFAERPAAREAIDAFSRTDRDFFCGPGWELLLDRVGLGGNYLVRLFEDDAQVRWVDWVSEALFVSYHAFGAGFPLDAFVHAGLGTAGRAVADERGRDQDPVYVSIFPMLVAGLGLDLDGFLFGGRFTWIPETSPPAGTEIVGYPVEQYQVALYAGIALGGHGHRHR
jgi:hypothetical protein